MQRFAREIAVAVFVQALLLLHSSGSAAEGRRIPSGLEIGERAPAFTLKDQDGKEVSLGALLKNGPVALVFYRSADWCMACQLQLIKLQRHLKEIEAANGQLVGISYDSPALLKRFAARKKITLPMLSDPGSKTIDAYGVRDKEASEANQGVANHAIFIVDQEGIIRARSFEVIYDEHPAIDTLIKSLTEAAHPKNPPKR